MKIHAIKYAVTLILGFFMFNPSLYRQKARKLEYKEESILEYKVDSVLALMNLNEKIGQLVQYNGSWDLTGPTSTKSDEYKMEQLKKGEVGAMLNVVSEKAVREAQKIVMQHSRLKIPLIFGYDVIHGYKTIFPIPLGETASWDLKIIEQSSAIAAKETAASGINWTFAPMLDVSRDSRWGRIMEGAGEDPYLCAKVGVARINGFQGLSLSDVNTIAACAKHFAGYGFAVAGRDYNTVNIGEYELNNVIMPPFRAAAASNVATFMNSFNDIDGIPATGHKILQRNILKGDWNWKGFIVSDWGSIGEMVAHGYAKNKKHAAEIAMNAGSDMDMQSYAYEENLEALYKEGKVSMKQIDDAVKRILSVKFRLGLFDDPYRYCDPQREKSNVYSKHNLNVARDVAKRSIVLLKNENEILPLSKDLKSIAVIGPFADDKDTPLGNWRAQAKFDSAVSLLEGVNNVIIKENVHFAKGIELTEQTLKRGANQFMHPLKFNNTDKSGIEDAVEVAKGADVVLLTMGEHAYQTGEGRSQTNIGFFGLQNELFEEIYKVNKNIIVILMNGRPMDLSFIKEKASGILECWFLGSESGNAIADVLFGDYNPSGKLPVSFPRHVGQEPLYYNQKNTGRPFSIMNVTNSSYRDAPNTALYPFGYGLSYTTFKYDKLKLSKNIISKKDELIVSVQVSNIGDRDGEEVVQLYIRDLVGSVIRPVKELKDFEKVLIKKGETKTITFTINSETLEFYTINKRWEVEPGEFYVWLGGDSTCSLQEKFRVNE